MQRPRRRKCIEQYRSELVRTDQRAINEANESLPREQRRAGITFVWRTTLEWTKYGHTVPFLALRAILANPLTTEKDINAVLDEQVRLARETAATS